MPGFQQTVFPEKGKSTRGWSESGSMARLLCHGGAHVGLSMLTHRG